MNNNALFLSKFFLIKSPKWLLHFQSRRCDEWK